MEQSITERRARLRTLMATHKLRCKHVARIVGREHSTVRFWRSSVSAQTISADLLAVLEAACAGMSNAAH